MIRLTIAAIIATVAFAGAAWASCTTHTYFLNGKLVTCTVCTTYGGSTTTTCF